MNPDDLEDKLEVIRLIQLDIVDLAKTRSIDSVDMLTALINLYVMLAKLGGLPRCEAHGAIDIAWEHYDELGIGDK